MSSQHGTSLNVYENHYASHMVKLFNTVLQRWGKYHLYIETYRNVLKKCSVPRKIIEHLFRWTLFSSCKKKKKKKKNKVLPLRFPLLRTKTWNLTKFTHENLQYSALLKTSFTQNVQSNEGSYSNVHSPHRQYIQSTLYPEYWFFTVLFSIFFSFSKQLSKHRTHYKSTVMRKPVSSALRSNENGLSPAVEFGKICQRSFLGCRVSMSFRAL